MLPLISTHTAALALLQGQRKQEPGLLRACSWEGGRKRAEKECLGKCCLLNLALRSEGGQRNERPGWAEVVKRGFLEGCGKAGTAGVRR